MLCIVVMTKYWYQCHQKSTTSCCTWLRKICEEMCGSVCAYFDITYCSLSCCCANCCSSNAEEDPEMQPGALDASELAPKPENMRLKM